MMYTLPSKSEFNSMMDKLLNKINNCNAPEDEALFIEDENPFEDLSDETARSEKLTSEAEIEIAQLKQQLAAANAEIAYQKTIIKKKDEDIAEHKRVLNEAVDNQENAEEECAAYKQKYEELERRLSEAQAHDSSNTTISVEEIISEAHVLDSASRRNLISSLKRLLAKRSGDITALLDAELDTIDSEILDAADVQDKYGRTMKVVIKCLYEMMRKMGTDMSTDNTVLSKVLSYLGGYDAEMIRQYLSSQRIPNKSKKELEKANALFKSINADISID